MYHKLVHESGWSPDQGCLQDTLISVVTNRRQGRRAHRRLRQLRNENSKFATK
jgi:hypothetical protein